MRRTCCSSTTGSLSLLRTARSRSSSSGMLLQRKNESREASSRSLMRYGVPGATWAGSGSVADTKTGDPRENLHAASLFVLSTNGPAYKNLATAGGFPRALDVVRATDGNVLDG